MFRMGLFKIRAFAAGNAAALLGSVARGGLQFMLVIWLAGIWLPLHGYNYEDTPLWAGIYLLPLTAGFLLAGPAAAAKIAHLPPVSTLFAALLGYNPIRTLLAPTGALASLSAGNAAVLTGRGFFPSLIAGPFHHALITVFTAAAAMALTGALVSLLRGGQFYYREPGPDGPPAEAPVLFSPHCPLVSLMRIFRVGLGIWCGEAVWRKQRHWLASPCWRSCERAARVRL
jgi:hypothetical protein